MSDNTYNGWTNYETWAVALWINNEQASYHYWRNEARRHRQQASDCQQVAEGFWTPESAAQYGLADQLKDEFEENAPIEDAGVYADLLDGALAEVNWQEIAAGILDEL